MSETRTEAESADRVIADLRARLAEAEQRGRALEEATRAHCEALRAIPYDPFYAEECCTEAEHLLALSAPPPGEPR